MAATSRTIQRRSVRALVAAAKRLGGGDQPVRRSRRQTRTGEGWKAEAWLYFDAIPEVKFAANFKGAALSRLRYYPAIVVEAEDAPMSVIDAAKDRDVTDEDDGVPFVTQALADAAVEEFNRLAQGPDGFQGLLREFGVQRTITGDSYLCGWDGSAGETWAMLPDECVKSTDASDVYKVKDPDTGSDMTLNTSETGDDTVARLWQRHSRWPWMSDSNLRACLDICEELLIYNRALRAIGKSQTPSGLVTLPNELDFDTQRVVEVEEELDRDDPDADPIVAEVSDQDDLTDLERGFIAAIIGPTADDGDPGSVAPTPIRGPAEFLAAIRYISLAREIDPQIIGRIEHLIRRLAQGLDVPPEVLTGMADSNHWTAWQIEDTTYKAHIEPPAADLARGIAAVFLRPALLARAEGFDPMEVARIVIGIDPSDLVVRPNRTKDAETAFDKMALSWSALRKYLAFPDTDAPDEAEMILRYAMERGMGGLALTRDLFHVENFEDIPTAEDSADVDSAAAGGSSNPAPDDQAEEGGTPMPTPPSDQAGRTARALAAVTAAGNAQSDVGGRLAGLDGRLRERVQAAASAALSAALDVAGKRLRAAVQGNPALARKVKGVDNAQIGSVLGDGYTDTAELLTEGDFDELHGQWVAWVGAAHAAAVQTVRDEALARGVDEARVNAATTEASATAERDSDAGWALLLAGLLTLGRARIFTPDGEPDLGEGASGMSVPMGPVRESLAVAGGGPGTSLSASFTDVGGPATGRTALQMAQRLGASVAAWKWSTGFPLQPFHPHQSLGGRILSGPTDPELLYPGWPADGGYLAPGDHAHCQCSLDPVVIWVDAR